MFFSRLLIGIILATLITYIIQQPILDRKVVSGFEGLSRSKVLQKNDLFNDLFSPLALQMDKGLVATGQFKLLSNLGCERLSFICSSGTFLCISVLMVQVSTSYAFLLVRRTLNLKNFMN